MNDIILTMRSLKKHKFYLIACTLIFSLQCIAQESKQGLWESIELQKKWKNGIAVSFEEDFRLRDDFTTTDKFMTTFELSYKPLSFLKTGVSYCRINYNHPGKKSTNYIDYWELRNRYSLYLQGSYKIGRFDLSLRERYQNTYRLGLKADSTRANPKEVLRSKLAVSYDFRGIPLAPYFYCEWQHLLNDPSGKISVVDFRYSAGLEYTFSKKLTLQAGYLHDEDKEDEESVKALTLGLGYSF